MAHSRRSSFRRTSGASRRQSSWAIGPNGFVTGVVASSNNLFSVAAVAGQDGLTIVRTRGELLVYQTVAGGAANEGFRWALGLGIVSAAAFAIGVTAMPAPLTDIDWDGWFVYETGTVISMFTGLGESSPMQSRVVPIDSKAMRKIKNTDVVVAMLETEERGDGATLAAQLSTRMLSKIA